MVSELRRIRPFVHMKAAGKKMASRDDEGPPDLVKAYADVA
jgi:hypothetical protein